MGLAGALAIGVVGAITVSAWLVPFVLLGGLLVPAYNLELAGGRVHQGWVFALAWGGFPALTGYFAQGLVIRPAGLLVAAACSLLSVVWRQISPGGRSLRSGVSSVPTGRPPEKTMNRLRFVRVLAVGAMALGGLAGPAVPVAVARTGRHHMVHQSRHSHHQHHRRHSQRILAHMA
jgi:hypothetical protein